DVDDAPNLRPVPNPVLRVGHLRRALPGHSCLVLKIYTGSKEIRLVLSRLNAEEIQKLVLPLADKRLWHNQQDALRAFRAALSDNQTGLDRFSEANLIREDTTAFAQTPERKNHRVNLVRVRINARLALRRGIALSLIRPSDSNEIFRE